MWAVIGAVVFPICAALTMVEMQHGSLVRVAPIVGGVVVFVAGVVQFTAWKARSLACWQRQNGGAFVFPTNERAAWRQGVCLAIECGRSSANLMLVLMVVGVMDVRAMVGVTTAITIERLAPGSWRVAPVTGVFVVFAGVLQMVR
jgi:predicted metal-binding membrane protein